MSRNASLQASFGPSGGHDVAQQGVAVEIKDVDELIVDEIAEPFDCLVIEDVIEYGIVVFVVMLDDEVSVGFLGPQKGESVVVAFVGGVAEPFLRKVLVLVGPIDDVPPRGMKRPLKLEDFICREGLFLRRISSRNSLSVYRMPYRGLRPKSGAFA
jgi:hypothetical protein